MTETHGSTMAIFFRFSRFQRLAGVVLLLGFLFVFFISSTKKSSEITIEDLVEAVTARLERIQQLQPLTTAHDPHETSRIASSSSKQADIPSSNAVQKPYDKESVVNVFAEKPKNNTIPDTFKSAIERQTGGKDTIILASVDSGYIEMAYNLYETSILKFGLTNFLFVSTDDTAHRIFREQGIPSYLGKGDSASASESVYGTAAFRRKTHLKTYMILDALNLGYNVLLVDVDIVFLKDPFSYFSCDTCDIQYQWDGSEMNSGFYLVRPTHPAKTLHSKAIERAKKQPHLSNQKTIARTLEAMIKAKEIHAVQLDSALFPRGEVYYEQGQRMFYTDKPCEKCVIVHNNWIVGGAAKRYRFKEFQMWVVDTKGYYSNPDARYLMYENPSYGATVEMQLDAFKYALWLGHLLNRTVILPSFLCSSCNRGACKVQTHECSLNTHISLKTLDANLAGKYREHVFLNHPKIPDNIKQSHSKRHLLSPSDHATDESDVVITHYSNQQGPTVDTIITALGDNQDSVIKLGHLYGLYSSISKNDKYFETIIKGIRKCDYRQYCDF